MPIGDFDKAATLAEDYLIEYGNVAKFFNGLTEGQRLGQAFFNALCERDQERLQGNIRDPFHRNDQESIYVCIDYLLTFDD